MRHNVIVRAVLFAGIASAVLDPKDAEAQFEQRVSPTICSPGYNNTYHTADGRMENDAGGAPGAAVCPLQDNSAHPNYSADYVRVYVHDNGRRSPADHTKAQLCITPYGVDGTFCGSFVTSPAFGYQELALSTGYWNGQSVAGFPYVYVYLAYWADPATSGPSSVEGIVVGYQ
jgi:hypothetical protein